MADTMVNENVDHTTENEAEQVEKTVLYLHPSDNSSFVLASSPLDGSNFLAWSRAVYVSLGCKMKLGFIDGTFPRPAFGSAKFEQWRRADLMVTSWLWNSISKEIVEAFMYASSSRELWLELQARYGRSNGPMVYQIEQEISSISQGEMSLTAYLTKAKKLWNELTCLAPSPKCTCGGCSCGINKAINDMNASNQLLQFLMGLHESFDKEKSQVLMIDPLLDLEKAYSMILGVEKQRSVQVNLTDSTNHAAFQLSLKDNRREGADRQLQRRRPYVDKRNLTCSNCHKSGNNSFAAAADNTPVGPVVNQGGSATNKADVADMVPEILKVVQHRSMPSDPITNFANFAKYDDEFAGNVSSHKAIDLSDWIIDTGATTHICAHLSLFHSYSKPTHPHYIHLPDGSKKQDQATKETMAVGSLFRNLYILKSCDHQLSVKPVASFTDVSCSTSVQCNTSTWHKRLGHASMPAIRHITDCNISDSPVDFALYGESPSYEHLRVFGCLCFATNLDPHKSKFHKRAHKCILLGYAMTQKAYKLYDLDDHVTFTSRDVLFHENVFPYATDSSITPPSYSPHVVPICYEDSTLDSFIDSCVAPTPSTTLESHSSTSFPYTSPTVIPTSVPPHNTSPPLRRSHRTIHKHVWLNDFVSHHTDSSLLHSTNSAYLSFVASLSILQEPRSFAEAVKHPEWRKAMEDEIQALEQNHTWVLTTLPAGKKPISCKWVFKTKLKADDSVESYKARLVAKGYNQIEGIDYTDSFSPVAKAVTVRLFLTLSAANSWALQQLDINNAFLHGFLDEDLYMSPPEGYQVAPGLVCKLERSLYGLKHASRQWNVELTVKLQEYGFRQSTHDHCLFTLSTASGLMALLVYVDDILIVGSSMPDIQFVKGYLHNLSTIKDIGDAQYFLGLEIARNSTGIYLAQTKYTQDIIKDTGLQHAKTVSTHFPKGLKLSSDSGSLLQQPDSYRRLVGRLLYLGFTRPDISHSIQQLSQFLNHPCEVHWTAALHVVRYLKGCPSKGLFLPSVNSLVLKEYCDADWVSCTDSRSSLTGFCIFLGDALISWKTKKQSTVSHSTAEAEYHSLAATVCELRWISHLLTDFGVSLKLLIDLFCDNKAALHILANPVFHERTKHIELDCHLVRDAYKDGFISPVHVWSSQQFADLFTKSSTNDADAMETGANLHEDDAGAGAEADIMDQG
ncbi:UNVERIFIED_CONTAM: Retrovirus-related Pol polyprotein from transposon RE2 [Sesamum latifolium]|uniref:Retrovirus-related Pol polyprotein from transposon RE2 n=1 Tax=Sesamum latifolium TaxID=2727402 RepID=A0AAW2UKM4_9LAMI